MNISYYFKQNEPIIYIIGMMVLALGIAWLITPIDEISDDQYKELYIECQQSKEMRILAKDYMGDNIISQEEYDKLMCFKLLKNKQVFQSVIQ